MSTIINASTSSGLVQTADNSGTLVLQSNGITQQTIDSTGSYGQLKLGTAQASTSGTSIDFTSIPSWVKRITVMFNGVSTNGTSFKQLQLGTVSGIVNTGYLSYSCKWGVSGVANGQNYTSGIGMSSNLAAEILSGSFTISLQGSNVWCVNGLLADSSSSVGIPVTGAKTLSDTLTQIRITTINGTDTFDAGSINILYEG